MKLKHFNSGSSVFTSHILTFSGWGTLSYPSFSPSIPIPLQKNPSNLGSAHVSSLLTPLVYFLEGQDMMLQNTVYFRFFSCHCNYAHRGKTSPYSSSSSVLGEQLWLPGCEPVPHDLALQHGGAHRGTHVFQQRRQHVISAPSLLSQSPEKPQ